MTSPDPLESQDAGTASRLYALDDVECRSIDSTILDCRMRLTVAPTRGRPEHLLVVLDPFLWLPAVITFVRALDQLEHVIPATAVVGVEHDTDGDNHRYWSLRARDFTPHAGAMPASVSQVPLRHGTGRAADFVAHLADEVFPTLAELDLDVDTTDRTVMGWSLSGLFVLASTILAPGLFARHIAVSPSLFWANAALVADRNPPVSECIYLAAGAREEPSEPSADEAALIRDTRMLTNIREFAEKCPAPVVTVDIARRAHHYSSGHETLHRAIATSLGVAPGS